MLYRFAIGAIMDTPKNCCGREPDVFRDIKVGSTEQMWIVNCCQCGKYRDGITRKQAVQSWNEPA